MKYWFLILVHGSSLCMQPEQKKAMVIGASSGIGRKVARCLAQKKYDVGVTARRVALLKELKNEIEAQTSSKVFVKKMDITNIEETQESFQKLVEQMGGLDLIIINAGILSDETELELKKQQLMITVNVNGFAALALLAADYFEKQQSGHIVGISSISSLRGHPIFTTYSATKAFMDAYLEGLRYRFAKKQLPITVTTIRPGLVETSMAQEQIKHGKSLTSWMATPQEAASQIISAIDAKKQIAYITKKWWFIALLLQWLPDCIYHKLL